MLSARTGILPRLFRPPVVGHPPPPPRCRFRTADFGAGPGRASIRGTRSASGQSTRLSISQGPDEPPLLRHTIPEHFASVVSAHGDRPAVVCRSPTTSAASFSGPAPTGIPAARQTTLTYAELDQTSNSLAHSLRALGVRKGDRVAVKLGNCAEFAALTYAVFKLGAVLVPLNPAFNAAQVAAALAHLAVEVFVVGAVTDLPYRPCRGRPNLPLVQALVPNLESPVLESPLVPSLRRVVVVDNSASHPGVAPLPLPSHRALTPFATLWDLATLAASSTRRAVVPDAPLAAAETVNIQFTSGTTSNSPKAAMLTHEGILNNGALVAHRMGLAPADVVVCPPPLFHCFGSVLGYMATATTGAAIAFPSPAFDPAASLRAAADLRATAVYGVATMFVAMLDALGAEGRAGLTPSQAAALPSHLRTGIAAGSSVPSALMARLFDRLGVPELVICYGQTETSPVSVMTAPADPLDRRTSTVGRAMPHTRVKIVDPRDRTHVLPRGEKGELAAAGYLVMKGYWADEARTAEDLIVETDVDGGGRTTTTAWMYSGDEACMDDDGYVAITGRIKDLIIRGGENIHPLEVENRLFAHPLVDEASVVGVPDERHGECVGAFVVARPGVRLGPDDAGRTTTAAAGTPDDADAWSSSASAPVDVLTRADVRDWVRAGLSSHLVPRYVFWIDEFPKTASGKIQKFKLREMAVRLVQAAGRDGEAASRS